MDSPSETLLESLRGLLPAIRSRREEVERARRLPRDLVDELRKTGLFSLSIPRAVGGREAAPREILRAIETVSTADGSTGWCAMVGTANNLTAGYMNEAGAKEVFADPTVPSAGIAAPIGAARPADGGYRIQGRWPFASGITHCDWLWAGCTVMENGSPKMTPHGPQMIHACVPLSDVQIHDTWFVSGLAGTGSHDVSVADAFVPERRVFSLFDPSGHRKEPLYQLPPIGWFVSQVVSVSLGLARGALDELMALAQTKVPTMSAAVLADRPVAQIDLARAEAALAAARAGLHDSVEELWQAARAGAAPTPRQIALNRAAAIHAAETGASVTRTAHVLAGGSAIYSSSSLQRHMRDAEAILHHFTVAPHVWEDAGRVFLGRPPAAPMF
jgi:alkylation response protein AidB-like acyl-CoA dehydrogenase